MFGYDRISFWIVLTAIFVNVACALLGSFLVLRRMSLMGDAISHAILPGLAVGFMLSGTRNIGPMLAAALVVGVLTAFFTQVLHNFAKVPEDAAMGVVFTSLFAVGVILIHRVARQVDLDPSCVLYGMLETAALDTVTVAGYEISRPALNMGIACVAVIAFITLMWKELKIVAFDPELATSQGINASVVHYLLMAMVAAVTVVAFEAVGSILVVAMLIVPAAAAYLLTDSLGYMVIISAMLGIISAISGRDLAHRFETSVPGMMAVVAGVLLFLSVFFAPKHGLLMKKVRQFLLSLRIAEEDLLALLYRIEERTPGVKLSLGELRTIQPPSLMQSFAMRSLRRKQQIRVAGSGETQLELTSLGSRIARSLVSSHRLWEAYLQNVMNIQTDHLHSAADRAEHFISEKVKDAVAREVNNPATDPHGKPIPERK